MKNVLVVCLFVALTVFSGTAYAEWMWAQGNAAHVENLADCTYKNFGWGLDIAQNPGFANWVHMPIPSKAGGTWGAQTFKLRFYTGSVDAWVSDVHVYNGDNKVKEFTGLTYSDGWKTVQFNLGKKVLFTKGMSLAIKINAGVESMSHRLIFSGAGANFIE